MKRLKRIDLLAKCGKFDRATRYRFDRQGRTAPGIPIQLRENDASQCQLLIKALGYIYRVLTRHGVHDQEHFIRLGHFVDLTELLHQGFVDMEPACGIDQQIVITVVLRMLQSLTCNFNRTVALGKSEHRYLDLFAQHLKLLNCSRPVNIPGH